VKKSTLLALALVLIFGAAPILSQLPAVRAQSPIPITFVHIYTDERDVRGH